MDKFWVRKLNGFSFKELTSSVWLSKWNEYFNFRASVLYRILWIQSPSLFILLGEGWRNTSWACLVPLRTPSLTWPTLWEVNTNEHIIEDISPVHIVYKEFSIFLTHFKPLILIFKKVYILIDLNFIFFNFITFIRPFSVPFFLAPWISDSNQPWLVFCNVCIFYV